MERNPLKIETVSKNRAFDGAQGGHSHASAVTGTDMTFAVSVPRHDEGAKVPVSWYLSELTCSPWNFIEKGEVRAACAKHGLILIAPDTYPRRDDVPDTPDAYIFRKETGFYMNAPERPWATNCRMRSYIESELSHVIEECFPVGMIRQSITGPSMGGASAATGIETTIRIQERCDHSYYFVSTFMSDHVAWRVRHLM